MCDHRQKLTFLCGKPFSTVSSLLGLNGARTPCSNLLLYALLRILELLWLIDGAPAPSPVALIQGYYSGEKSINYGHGFQSLCETSTKLCMK